METKSGDGEVVDLTEARSDCRAPAGAVLGADGKADVLVAGG